MTESSPSTSFWSSASDGGPEGDNGVEEHQLDYLELMDIEALGNAQDMKLTFSTDGHLLGTTSSPDVCVLGRGLNYFVTRVSSRGISRGSYPGDKRLNTSKAFVVVKKPLISSKDKPGGDGFRRHLYAVMLELRILFHKPVREHPNIIRLLEFMWDAQDDTTKIAPSLILEYADLGTLADFQDPKKLSLRAITKLGICLDVAEGLSFLHKCGIVHGDVKSDNILLFRAPSVSNSGGLGICAKLSDFGCSLIEVFPDRDGLKQDLPGGTRPWDAPEGKKGMSALKLHRTDIYSYGLLVWRIMCNGTKPFDLLPWENDPELAKVVPETKFGRHLTKQERFELLKSKGNWVKRLAKKSLLNRHHGVAQLKSVDAVMDITIEMNPDHRAKSMDDIVFLLKSEEVVSFENDQEVTPEPLMKGDFGISSPTFPVKLFWLRNSPPSFRAVIHEQLVRNSVSASTSSKRHFSHLAIAVFYEQGLMAALADDTITGTDGEEARLKTAEALVSSAQLGNHLAQNLVFGVCRAYDLSSRTSVEPKADWLVASIRNGSIRARNELKAFSVNLLDETIDSILLCRRSVASALTSESLDPVDAKFLEQFPDLDPAAKGILTQPGIGRIHQAAFLGSLEVLDNLIMRQQETSAHTPSGETPLHYATLGGQQDATTLLIKRKFDVDAQSQHGASSLHYALLSLHPESMVDLLLKHGSNPNILSRTSLEGLPARCDYFLPADGSPLHFAVVCENSPVVRSLLDAGANPNMKSERGLTALESAIQIHSLPLVNLLLQYGTRKSTELPNIHRIYPFLSGQYLTPMAKTLTWTEKAAVFVEAVVESFEDFNIDLSYQGILAAAFDANDADIVNHCLRKLDSNQKLPVLPFRCRNFYNDGTTVAVDLPLLSDTSLLLEMIIAASKPEIIKYVLQYAKKPLGSKRDPSGLSVLCHLASRPMTTPEDMLEVVKALIDHGVDPAAAKERYKGPLHSAVVYNNYHALDALLKFNLSMSDIRDATMVCTQRGNSWTAFRMLRSIWRRHPFEISRLAHHQVDIASNESQVPEIFLDGYNPLSSLCMTWEHGRDDSLHETLLLDMIHRLKLLPEGSKVLHQLLNQENNQIMMYTPLHHAASNGNVSAVRILIEEGADVNYSGKPSLDPLASLGILDMASLGLDDDIANAITAASRGLTPLDAAQTRNWHMSIYAWPQWDRSVIQTIRNAGGLRAEERRYDQRTAKVVELLRDKHAKTKAELFNIPEPAVVANKAQHKETMRRFEARENSQTASDSVSKIMQIFQASCELPSAQLTMAKFPDLAADNDPDRPRLSSLAVDVDGKFQYFIDTDGWCDRNVQQFEQMKSAHERFIVWATRNGVANGDIDKIQDAPPPSQSIQLAASILMCLFEIIHTLQMLKELTSKTRRSRDYLYRVEEFLADLDKVIATIAMESLSLLQLSEMANAAVAEQLNAPSIFDHLLPSSVIEPGPA